MCVAECVGMCVYEIKQATSGPVANASLQFCVGSKHQARLACRYGTIHLHQSLRSSAIVYTLLAVSNSANIYCMRAKLPTTSQKLEG